MSKKSAFLLLMLLTLAGCDEKRPVLLQKHAKPREEALAISSAFAANNAKGWRKAATAQLTRIDRMSRDELAEAATAYRLIAVERGVQGLESTLLSTLAALGQYDYAGWIRAREELVALSKVLTAAPESAHPQARVAIKSAGNPVIHHIPLHFARTLLNAQVRRGLNAQALDIDSVLKGDMCSEGAIASAEAKYGKGFADLLRSVCQGNSDGPASGRAGAGPLAGMSEFSCLPEHQPTRAERVSKLVDACLSSQVEAGGSPLGLGIEVQKTFRDYAKQALEEDWRKGRLTYYEGSNGAGSWEFVNDKFERKMTEEIRGDGTRTVKFYEQDPTTNKPVERVSVEFDKNDKILSYSETLPNGTKLEVIQNADGGYTFRESHTSEGTVKVVENTYDKNGKRVSGSVGNPATGWGKTPECRELTLALMRESAISLLESCGLVNPHTVRPDRESDALVEAGDFGCFDLTGGAQMDASFFCADGLKLCGPGQIVDENCVCQTVAQGVTPSTMCSLIIVCYGGKQLKEVNGQCSCVDAEQMFVDPVAGGGPRPLPVSVDRLARRPDQ